MQTRSFEQAGILRQNRGNINSLLLITTAWIIQLKEPLGKFNRSQVIKENNIHLRVGEKCSIDILVLGIHARALEISTLSAEDFTFKSSQNISKKNASAID
jgi:hypothetical protein